MPPSLKNIYTELESDLEGEFRRPTHGHLAAWARRGVLLLNATRTPHLLPATFVRDEICVPGSLTRHVPRCSPSQ